MSEEDAGNCGRNYTKFLFFSPYICYIRYDTGGASILYMMFH